MLKVRLMGTKNDIVWFQKILIEAPFGLALNSQFFRPTVNAKVSENFTASFKN